MKTFKKVWSLFLATGIAVLIQTVTLPLFLIKQPARIIFVLKNILALGIMAIGVVVILSLAAISIMITGKNDLFFS